MKIANTNDYLKYRSIVLSNEYTNLMQEHENNKILMSEVRKKIDEIKNVVDEGFEMFSPKGAQEKVFNKQEVKELQIRLLLLVDDNKELDNRISLISDELKIINMLLGNDSDINVKSMVAANASMGVDLQDDIIDKLKLCSDIVEFDPRRVKSEIKNIIDKISDK